MKFSTSQISQALEDIETRLLTEAGATRSTQHLQEFLALYLIGKTAEVAYDAAKKAHLKGRVKKLDEKKAAEWIKFVIQLKSTAAQFKSPKFFTKKYKNARLVPTRVLDSLYDAITDPDSDEMKELATQFVLDRRKDILSAIPSDVKAIETWIEDLKNYIASCPPHVQLAFEQRLMKSNVVFDTAKDSIQRFKLTLYPFFKKLGQTPKNGIPQTPGKIK